MTLSLNASAASASCLKTTLASADGEAPGDTWSPAL